MKCHEACDLVLQNEDNMRGEVKHGTCFRPKSAN